MNALDCIERISNTSLINDNLKFCLINDKKLPFQIDGKPARSNDSSTFVDFATLLTCQNLEAYEGVGISVQSSEICAVDIDHCLEKANDFSTMSDLAKEIVDMFKDFAYVEASFSGLGIRILTRQQCVPDYKRKYYLKNSKIHLEYYQYDQAGRYVSLTGNCFVDNDIDDYKHYDVIEAFLEKYMKRPHELVENNNSSVKDDRSTDQLMKLVKSKYRRDNRFQDLWFDKAPGHGSNESERDYQLIATLYEDVTQDPDKILEIFMKSEFYKTKDRAHIYKFTRDNYHYFWYLYKVISCSK